MTSARILLCLFLSVAYFGYAQEVELKGQVKAEGDVEGIHILNISLSKYSTTNVRGQFIIPARLNDTIAISSIVYKKEPIIVDLEKINSKTLIIELKEKITELDEVVVGKVLTGDLSSDMDNTEVKDEINFYDVGIPGYTGKRMTQNERRLYDANSGRYFAFYGIAASINVYKILNAISGRTKRLKRIVAQEHLDLFILRIRDMHLQALFEDTTLTEQQVTEFFYYCGDDIDFVNECKFRSDIEVHGMLEEKLLAYTKNLQSNND